MTLYSTPKGGTKHPEPDGAPLYPDGRGTAKARYGEEAHVLLCSVCEAVASVQIVRRAQLGGIRDRVLPLCPRCDMVLWGQISKLINIIDAEIHAEIHRAYLDAGGSKLDRGNVDAIRERAEQREAKK